MLDPNDGGWGSRKLWYSVLTSALIFAGAVIAARWTPMASVYPEMTMALLGALSVFAGANVFSRWTIARNAPALAEAAKQARYYNPDGQDAGVEAAARGTSPEPVPAKARKGGEEEGERER